MTDHDLTSMFFEALTTPESMVQALDRIIELEAQLAAMQDRPLAVALAKANLRVAELERQVNRLDEALSVAAWELKDD